MAIRTLDTTALAEATGNLYETTVVLSKRARQIAAQTRSELESKLAHFEDLSLDPAEEIRSNEDQLRISLEYERKPKPTAEAIGEMEADALYFRRPGADAPAR